jgi:hypothetical protein
MSAYAAGIADSVRVIFLPAAISGVVWSGNLLIKGLQAGRSHHGFYFDPKTGQEYDLGSLAVSAEGEYCLAKPPIFQDWVVVITSEQ